MSQQAAPEGTTLAPELAAVAEFLAQTLPFNELQQAYLLQVAGRIVVQYHRRGEQLDEDSQPMGLRILRSGAVDIRDSDNKLLDRLGEGESFHIGGLNAESGGIHAVVIEDALIYFLADEYYFSARERSRHVDRYFSRQRSRRLRRAARYQPEPNTLLQQVATVMSTDLMMVHPGDRVQDVARSMSDRRVSSAFVVDAGVLKGILTDRDLRDRVVSRARPPETPVAEIMTPEPETIQADQTLFATTLMMTQRGYHHLPVMQGDELVGIVTVSDLILARKDDPVYLVQHISRQHDVAGMRDLVAGMADLMVQWVQSGMRAQQVSQILTAISDAVTVRLIQLAVERFGPAPVSWAWLGFGSQARAEQLLGADQDNGIVIADEVDAAAMDWFHKVADFVCDGLNDCGYMHCPGGIMAKTREWCQPLSVWQRTVRKWAVSPTPDAVMRVSIFFDLRCIWGDQTLTAALQETMLATASSNSIFLAALAANCLDSTPPLGIFRRFVVDRDGEHRDSLDLKKRGVLPVTEIVRLHALANSVGAVNTEERLRELASAKHMTMTDSRNLADALSFIQHQRIEHQCQQILAGEAVSNYLNPKSLSKMAREQLRDAFTIIDEAQAAIRQTYRAGLG